LTQNGFIYALDNPAFYTDPSGLEAEDGDGFPELTYDQSSGDVNLGGTSDLDVINTISLSTNDLNLAFDFFVDFISQRNINRDESETLETIAHLAAQGVDPASALIDAIGIVNNGEQTTAASWTDHGLARYLQNATSSENSDIDVRQQVINTLNYGTIDDTDKSDVNTVYVGAYFDVVVTPQH
jgi:hypothetical protein